jgi:peptide deformylase
MVLDLVDKNDPILREELPRFNFSNPPTDPIQLAHDLAESMIHHEGLGLAANQIGLPYRAFAMMGEQIIVCFNPMIVDYSPEEDYLDEGCLSYPNLFVRIKRPMGIKMRYTEPNGNIVTRVFAGMTARVAQHELDHLNGIVHTRRATPYHLEKAKKQLKKLEKAGGLKPTQIHVSQNAI